MVLVEGINTILVSGKLNTLTFHSIINHSVTKIHCKLQVATSKSKETKYNMGEEGYFGHHRKFSLRKVDWSVITARLKNYFTTNEIKTENNDITYKEQIYSVY